MAIPSPVILLPTNGSDYATDVATQTISGTTSSNTAEITVNGSNYGVSYTAGETIWSWTGTILFGSNTINIVALEKNTLTPSLPATINVTLTNSTSFVTVTPPTGVKLNRYNNRVDILTTANPEPKVVGYNFYVSTRSGGISGAYAKINSILVTEPTFQDESITQLNRAVDTAGNIRVTTITEEVTTIGYYSATLDQTTFDALVASGQIDNVAFSEENKLFFVVTALIYDTASSQVTESAYSAELEGSPIVITTGIKDLPQRSQNDIVLTVSDELLTNNPGIDTKPGTVIRDLVDPFTEEMARVYVIQDFISRSQSVSALMDFDDSNGDGVSDAVNVSPQKTGLQIALNLQDPAAVQQLIDDQFDKLASNADMTRKPAVSSTGTVIFYTLTKPIRDMNINEGAIVATVGDLDLGIASQTYQTTTSKVMSVSNIDAFYNSSTQRYEVSADVVSVTPGFSSNTDSNTIQTIQSGVDSDFLVENPNPISFGEDKETNHQLGGRIQLAYFTDTGTEGGYARTALAVPGVINVRVEKAGDPLMIRDYDSIRKEHIGGKVDIYLQGHRNKQVTDQIAFSFGSIASQGGQVGERFDVINAISFQFKSTNPLVTAHTPIFDVTRVHNATRNADYDIAGYQIIGDGNTVDLDETKTTNVNIGLASADVIYVDYKYRGSDIFILEHQPVIDIVSVTGQLSGPLTSDNWELVSLDDPLADGNSTIAHDGLRIKFANNLPVTGFQVITNEIHVLFIDTNDPLKYIGVDPESIVVKDATGAITYVENIDYLVVVGGDTTPTYVRMLESGSLTNGQTVMISYTAIENFKVVYDTNSLLETVQNKVDEMKHACADVIVKQSVENKIDFVMTVVPKSSVNSSGTNTTVNNTYLASQIRTAITNYITQLDLGTPLSQSEIVKIVQSVPDVAWVVVPFSRMVKADGSFIPRDDIGMVQWQVFNEGVVRSYITSSPVLRYGTVDNGGPANLFRGVFEDEIALILMTDPVDVSGGAGRAYIRADGRLIASTRDGLLPDSKNFQASYWVYGETGAKDISVNSLEYLTVGNFTVSFVATTTPTKVL